MTGYFPLQHGESSYKEGFEIGQPVTFSSDEDSADVHPFFLEPNLWPGGMDGAEKFHEDIVKYYRCVDSYFGLLPHEENRPLITLC